MPELPIIDPGRAAPAVSEPIVALVGNPNAGKTTLFNALTGLRAKTGNFPGTTVDVRRGRTPLLNGSVELVDLPGLYSLDSLSPEEDVAKAFLSGELDDTPEPDAILLVLDATNLQRNLYLCSEILELGRPTVVALSLFDAASRDKLDIDLDGLAQKLDCPVIGVSALTGAGLAELKAAVADVVQGVRPARGEVVSCTVGCAGCSYAARHKWATDLTTAHVKGTKAGDASVSRIDKLATHPFIGVIGFLLVMLLIFYAIFSIASVPMDLIDAGFGIAAESVGKLLPESGPTTPIFRVTTFVSTVAVVLAGMWIGKARRRWWNGALALGGAGAVASLSVEDFRSLLTDGVVGGVGGVVIFLPQICILFFFISLLEDSGYMARAAFVMERLMRAVGLPGKAFVPMLSAHACAIPGIMAARVIEDRRDRLATIFVLPLLTCSARLPVYAMVTALLFGDVAWKASLLFTGAYVLGIAAALSTAWLLKKTALKGDTVPLVLELPRYRRPSLRNAFYAMYDRAMVFLRKAGTAILLISVILWWLANFPNTVATASTVDSGTEVELDETQLENQRLAGSFAGRLGRAVEPIFAPLGFDWRINIGVVSSFAAREVVVTTLAIVYGIGEEAAEDHDTLISTLRKQTRDDGSPVFDAPTSLSLLVFYVLAMQCLPTQVATRRETGAWKYAIYQLVYMSVLAYLAAFVTFQIATGLAV